ncbi:hypothetical protein LINPERPRIM_LOCUS25435 [Linum perenne]
MKLMGPHHHIRKQQSSNSTSSPTSPPSTVFGDSSSQVTTATSDPDSARHPKDNINDLDHAKLQQLLRCESVNSTAVHNLRLSEDDNPGYDSSSSFEFQKDRSYAQSHQLTRSFSRPTSTKLVDFCQTASQVGFENSSFIAPATPSLSGQAYGGNLLIEMDQFSQCTDMKEVDQTTVSTKSLTEDRTGKGVCSLLLS